MNSKGLEQRLEEFFHPQPESKIGSIMVKGPWGVGKTKCVLDFIKKLKKGKSSITAMTSLFKKEKRLSYHRIYSTDQSTYS